MTPAVRDIGGLLEVVVPGMDESDAENPAQEVMPRMREAASRGSRMATEATYGHRQIHVHDGTEKRLNLEHGPGLRRRGPTHVRLGPSRARAPSTSPRSLRPRALPRPTLRRGP